MRQWRRARKAPEPPLESLIQLLTLLLTPRRSPPPPPTAVPVVPGPAAVPASISATIPTSIPASIPTSNPASIPPAVPCQDRCWLAAMGQGGFNPGTQPLPATAMTAIPGPGVGTGSTVQTLQMHPAQSTAQRVSAATHAGAEASPPAAPVPVQAPTAPVQGPNGVMQVQGQVVHVNYDPARNLPPMAGGAGPTIATPPAAGPTGPGYVRGPSSRPMIHFFS